MKDILFFSLRSTDAWWQYLAKHVHKGNNVVASDVRGDGDVNLVDSFYGYLKTHDCAQEALAYFSKEVCDDIIARCRVLRNLKTSQALSMIGAMRLTVDALIQKEKPKLIISFVIDRYVLDILAKVAATYHIRFIEMTASIIPEHVMFMDRGRLVPIRQPQNHEIVSARGQIINEKFVPAYVKKNSFTKRRFWKTFLSFKLRGLFFQGYRFIKRDKWNSHYLDALNYAAHKPRLGDHRVLNYFNPGWESQLESTPKEQRVFLGLQLLPEASLDYWLKDRSLLDNDRLVLEIAQVLGDAGYVLFIKDHPLQFGFRQRDIIKKLASLPYVVLIPYAIPAAHIIKRCSISVTCTGTIGFESALAGVCSIVSQAYYANDDRFIHFSSLDEIKKLPEKIKAFKDKTMPLSESVQNQMIEKVLAASVPGDLFSFKSFDETNEHHVHKISGLIQSLNTYLPQFIG